MIKLHRILFLFLLLLFTKENSFAQFFLNGDFEINTSAPCNFNMANTTWDAQMGSSNAYGLGSELDIMDGTCTYGSPQSGNWFVALAAPSGNTDAFTMTLSAPLVAGTTYTMQFYDKGDFTYTPAIPIVIGVSTAPGALGTVVYTGPVPTAGVWNLRNFTFAAPNNGQYISVSTTGVPRWTHVDNFSFTNTTSNTVTTDTISNYQFCACDTLSVPFTSSGVFLAGNVYSVQLSDATGSFFISYNHRNIIKYR